MKKLKKKTPSKGVKKAVSLEEKKEKKEKLVTSLLPIVNKDFTEGVRNYGKRFSVVNYFIRNEDKIKAEIKKKGGEIEIPIKEILLSNPALSDSRKNELGVAVSLEGKVERALRLLPKPLNLRIVNSNPKTFTNSSGGTKTLVTSYLVSINS